MSDEASLVEVRAAHRVDEARLGAYLVDHLAGFTLPFEILQFEGGQSNPTYRLQDAAGNRYVLRKKPPGKLLPSAHQVEREYRAITTLDGTEVPVPKARVLCEDADIIGTAFYVMDYVDGRVFTDPALPGLEREERAAVYDDMNRVLAALHQIDWEAQGLSDFGKAGDYIRRQVARWSKQYEASKTHDIPEMDRLMEWLVAHVPADDSIAIAHGDFRLGNLIFAPDQPRVVAVLDWELATLGHPLADLAYNAMAYHLPAGDENFPGVAGLDLDALGIPSEEDYLAAYCRRTGRDGVPTGLITWPSPCSGWPRSCKGSMPAPVRAMQVRPVPRIWAAWREPWPGWRGSRRSADRRLHDRPPVDANGQVGGWKSKRPTEYRWAVPVEHWRMFSVSPAPAWRWFRGGPRRGRQPDAGCGRWRRLRQA